MKENHDIKATVVGDADKELGCFEERLIDLIHVWREVNTAWQHGVGIFWFSSLKTSLAMP